jgi:hypothetical protein
MQHLAAGTHRSETRGCRGGRLRNVLELERHNADTAGELGHFVEISPVGVSSSGEWV